MGPSLHLSVLGATSDTFNRQTQSHRVGFGMGAGKHVESSKSLYFHSHQRQLIPDAPQALEAAVLSWPQRDADSAPAGTLCTCHHHPNTCGSHSNVGTCHYHFTCHRDPDKCHCHPMCVIGPPAHVTLTRCITTTPARVTLALVRVPTTYTSTLWPGWGRACESPASQSSRQLFFLE